MKYLSDGGNRCYDMGTVGNIMNAMTFGGWGSVTNAIGLPGGGDTKQSSIEFLSTSPKHAASGPGVVEPPDPSIAQQAALDAQTKSRKALLASGGSTGQGQSSPILGSDVHSMNLGGM